MSASKTLKISGAQCRAARALTDISRAMLADRSTIPESAIRDFENRLAEPDISVTSALKQALEHFGALFIDDDSQGGQGVRLKFSATESARIDRLENEGGQAAEDDFAP